MNRTSIILFTIGFFLLGLSLLPKVSNFLDIRSVFIEHFRIFRGNPLQFLAIFFAPILFSIAIVKIRCVNSMILDNLNVVLSILTAMFFSMLSILCAFTDKTASPRYRQLLQETFNSTIFEIFICLILLLISFMALFVGEYERLLYLKILSGGIYYLTIVAVLNILVIIKRVKVLFENMD